VKNPKKILTLFASLALLSIVHAETFAEGDAGNGGKTRVCTYKETGKETAELLDYWDGKITHGYEIDMGPGTYLDKIETVLARIKRFDPYRVRRLRTRINELQDNLERYMEDTPLRLTNDGETDHDPFEDSDEKRCDEVQFVYRRKSLVGNARRFEFVEKIWEMGEEDPRAVLRAGIFLHESSGENEILSKGRASRKNTMFYTYVVSTARFESFTAEDYLLLLYESRKTGGTIQIDGQDYLTGGLVLDKNTFVSGYKVTPVYAELLNLDYKGSRLHKDTTIELEGVTLELPRGTRMEQGFSKKSQFQFNHQNLGVRTATRVFEGVTSIVVYGDGSFRIFGDDLKPIFVQGHLFRPMAFYPSGAVSMIKIPRYTSERYDFQTESGEMIEIRAMREGKIVYFNEQEAFLYYQFENYQFENAEVDYKVRSMDEAFNYDPDYITGSDKLRLQVQERVYWSKDFNGDRKGPKATTNLRLEFMPMRGRDFRFNAINFNLDVDQTDDRRHKLELFKVKSYYGRFSDNPRYQWGPRFSAFEWEKDKLRNVETYQWVGAGLGLRWAPRNSNRLTVDAGVDWFPWGETRMAEHHDGSRVSQAWRDRRNALSGGVPGENYDMHKALSRRRGLESLRGELCLSYQNESGNFRCEMGTTYERYKIEDMPRDIFSPYNDIIDEISARWVTYLDLKYLFDQSVTNVLDPQSYVGLRLGIGISDLGQNLGRRVSPIIADQDPAEIYSAALGFGMEW